jgi:hypothetical protein
VPDWPVSFCIAVLSAAAYFGSIMTPPWRSRIEDRVDSEAADSTVPPDQLIATVLDVKL